MDLSFNFDNARFAFGNHDRVTIEGTAYKVELVTEDGVVFGTADGRGLCQQFTHGQLSRLASMGRLRQERDYFLATSAWSRLKSNAGLVSDLTGSKAAVHSKRSAYVEAFYHLAREKKIKRTDESIRANMELLRSGAIDVISNLPTILAAVQAIRERNAAAMQAADLLVETWDDTRIEREERRLFAQVKFAGEEPQKSGDGGLGRTIEAVHPDHDANDAAPKPAAVRAAKGDPAGKRPAGSKTTPTSRPAKSGGGFSIEEN